ncbi:Golgi SNAP receptor complex subunit 1 [Cryptosporidium tyzzeri]|nr:Golgi SNAP receptor complex subunit 1 [Cryptosporidium tyzzeri]
MSICLRGIQNALETKLGELDTLKSHDWNLEIDAFLDEEEKGTEKEGGIIMSEHKWEIEVQSLKNDICCLFDSFEKEVDILNNDGMNTDRYSSLLQNLKHDYNNICKYIDSRKKRVNLFSKSNTPSGNKYQKLYIDKSTESFERSQFYREKNIIKDSVLNLNSMIDQAMNTTQSLSGQNHTLKLILDKTRTMRKKSISNIQSVVNSIINLKKRQNFAVSVLFILFVVIIIYIKK